MDINQEALISELTFKAVRSSGSGGQHVNKVATKVELFFDVMASKVLEEDEKQRVLEALSNRVNKGQVLLLYSDDSRSQFKNKNLVIQKFLNLIEEALEAQKERVPTKIPKGVKKKRLQDKRKQSEKKSFRKPPSLN
ncbi:alternative ribosome rescue aminoacyl-tRNA hydrolase ArfB [Mangrovimonas sp. YM274]|uniref:alternative ribosome rescue aminoacyl-tRNA hydrolase ArfB n=1 Tax=Mangrovimonas sp. YM274 TaxID=3070660 RepID=UPI0027DD5E06|nr:alternative ribosome rescue aminoacyl-tRNA hydrolase ArfB [Mangrovimonas sp. YM274]WMI69293.1 alternative ribosome rescue aminoacyl-tRNA hydrolase ArfB [Mangrovimonas sp. YM274]